MADLSDAVWQKNAGGCLEIAFLNGQVLVRDSKDEHGPALRLTGVEWETFIGSVRDGEFDLPRPLSMEESTVGAPHRLDPLDAVRLGDVSLGLTASAWTRSPWWFLGAALYYMVSAAFDTYFDSVH